VSSRSGEAGYFTFTFLLLRIDHVACHQLMSTTFSRGWRREPNRWSLQHSSDPPNRIMRASASRKPRPHPPTSRTLAARAPRSAHTAQHTATCVKTRARHSSGAGLIYILPYDYLTIMAKLGSTSNLRNILRRTRDFSQVRFT